MNFGGNLSANSLNPSASKSFETPSANTTFGAFAARNPNGPGPITQELLALGQMVIQLYCSTQKLQKLSQRLDNLLNKMYK